MKKLLLKPLKALASPGIYLFGKYNQYKRDRQESNLPIAPAENELSQLNTKIEKLLSKLNGKYVEVASSPEEECVICVNAKAVIQTYPCGHKVVCRKCFVKTIQIALAQRTLPLRCVICRAKILRLRQTQGNRLPTASSSFHSRSSSCNTSKRLYRWSNTGYSFRGNHWPGGSKYSKSLPGINGSSLKYRSSVNRSYSTVVYRKSSNTSERNCCRSCSLNSYSSAKCHSQTSLKSSISYTQNNIRREDDINPLHDINEESFTRRKQSGCLTREKLIQQFQRDFREGQLTTRNTTLRRESIRSKSSLGRQPIIQAPISKKNIIYKDIGIKSLQKRELIHSNLDKHQTIGDSEDSKYKEKVISKIMDKGNTKSNKLLKPEKKDKGKYQNGMSRCIKISKKEKKPEKKADKKLKK